MTPKPVTLPVATIQHDFSSVFSDVDSGLPPEDIWVSVYKHGEPSVHGKVNASLDEVDRSLLRLTPRNGVQFKRTQRNGKDVYSAACATLEMPFTDIAVNRREWADPERSNPVKPHAVTAFDVSPDGTQFATGYHDGTIHLLSTVDRPTATLQKSKPHLSTVNALRFFPSSRVLLTAGNDFALTILPAEPSTSERTTILNPVRTLRAHTRSITAVEILDVGRNVLSASKDATVRLWDVGGGKVIRTAASAGFVPINAMTVGENTSSSEVAPEAPADGEVGTTNKLAFCALGDGTFEALDLGARRSAFHSETKGPGLTAISYTAQHGLLATGSAEGLIQIWDTRSLSTPVTQIIRGVASIDQLAFLPVIPLEDGGSDVGLAVTAADGLPFVTSVKTDGSHDSRVYAELVGPDCEHIGSVTVRGKAAWTVWGSETEIWIAADDGKIRMY